MLRPTVQTEDDPVGCMPNSALGIGVDEASPTTRPWSEVRKMRLTDEQLAALEAPTWDTNNNGTIDNNDEADAYAGEADLRKGADDEE